MIVERLKPKHIRAVYPLMRLADPSISFARWLQYAGGLSGRDRAPRGVLIAKRRSHLHPAGVVCYHCERDIDARMLVAENFVATDVLYPEALATALLTGLNSVAITLGCQAIRTVVTQTGTPLDAPMCMAALRLQGVRTASTLTWRVDTTQAALTS